MTCSICQHPKRQDIDQALIAGSATLTALSRQYGLSTSALHRHRAHLEAKVDRAKDQLQDILLQGIIFWLHEALGIIMQILQTGRVEGNSKVVLQATAQGTRIISMLLKYDLPLEPRVIYEMLASPEWATQDSLLPQDPKIMAMSRQFMTEALFAPCAEPAAPSSSPTTQEDLDALQAVSPDLAQPSATQPKTGNRKRKTGNRLFTPREKGGKLPGKVPFVKNNDEEKQEDKLFEKITGMMNLPILASRLPLETRNSELETIFQEIDKSGKIPTDIPLSEYIYKQSLEDKPGHCHPSTPRHPGNGNGTPQTAI